MHVTRAEELADLLAARIIDGTVAPGERLPSENKLVAEHGVSRTVVREALHRLQSRGLVRTRLGSGSYALTPPSDRGEDAWLTASGAAEREELHAFRIAIETEAAALAARRPDPAVLDELADALARLELATLPADTISADFAFHRAVAAASGNRYLLGAVDRLGPRALVIPPARIDEAPRDAAETAAVVAEHRDVLEALRRGDVLAASAAMRTHLVASTVRRSPLA
ncbi:FadR/GntR family transcriptional regulator [Gulosibacter faecalis]|uniref:FadR/GntR family transcriptional regulator n=1 Tax=Gulosibacter faecalis TaxID=272240 RepID=A0ABW5UXN0_9MICO|nr:FCD domain-containing protein [Gulosibacter faecalis]